MNPLFRKLQLKDADEIYVRGAPDELLRFRHVRHIGKMTRDATRALSRQGRNRASS